MSGVVVLKHNKIFMVSKLMERGVKVKLLIYNIYNKLLIWFSKDYNGLNLVFKRLCVSI